MARVSPLQAPKASRICIQALSVLRAQLLSVRHSKRITSQMPMADASYSQAAPSMLFFRPPTLDDLQIIYQIEASSYPEDEAATFEKLKFRIEQAPGQFLVAIQSSSAADNTGDGDQLIGYACGTCSTSSSLTHQSMSNHEPDGQLLCIHSVAVQEQHRRQGIASRLLRAYLQYVQGTTATLQEVRLICKQNLIPLYEKVGFTLIGPSSVKHGQDQWYEMMWKAPQSELN